MLVSGTAIWTTFDKNFPCWAFHAIAVSAVTSGIDLTYVDPFPHVRFVLSLL